MGARSPKSEDALSLLKRITWAQWISSHADGSAGLGVYGGPNFADELAGGGYEHGLHVAGTIQHVVSVYPMFFPIFGSSLGLTVPGLFFATFVVLASKVAPFCLYSFPNIDDPHNEFVTAFMRKQFRGWGWGWIAAIKRFEGGKDNKSWFFAFLYRQHANQPAGLV